MLDTKILTKEEIIRRAVLGGIVRSGGGVAGMPDFEGSESAASGLCLILPFPLCGVLDPLSDAHERVHL